MFDGDAADVAVPVGLRDAVGFQVDRGEVSAAKAIRVDADEVGVTEDLAARLGRVSEVDSLAADVRHRYGVGQVGPVRQFVVLVGDVLQWVVHRVDEDLRVGFVEAVQVTKEIQVARRNLCCRSAVAGHGGFPAAAHPRFVIEVAHDDALQHDFVVSP